MKRKIAPELTRQEAQDVMSALIDRAVIAISVERPDVAHRLITLVERIAQTANDEGWDI